MNVVSFTPRPEPEKAPPNEDAIHLLETVLARLKASESVDVAVVEVRRNGDVATAWSGKNSYHYLNSGAARLASRLASET